jgi:hypothetical protein
VVEGDAAMLLALVGLEPRALPVRSGSAPHPHYVAWSCDGVTDLGAAALRDALASRPRGLFRMKGTVRTADGSAWNVQVVGREVSVTRPTGHVAPALVGIGLASLVGVDEIQHWWTSRVRAT